MPHTYRLLLLSLFLGTSSLATPHKACADKEADIRIIVSTNVDGPESVKQLHALVSSTTPLPIHARNSGPSVNLVLNKIHSGDCVQYEPQEAAEFSLQFSEEGNLFKSLGKIFGVGNSIQKPKLVPVVYWKKQDESRHFGLMDLKNLETLHDVTTRETPIKELLAYPTDKRFTVLYVLCPKDRKAVCHLEIRHKGKWVNDPKSGKRLRYPVLGRSNRNGDLSQRILFGGDTPQGIYYLWGTMFTADPVFGNEPRIDLDANMPPVNSYVYELNSPVLDGLVPESARKDYWIHEWPLAYKLGRSYLRIHTNPEIMGKKSAAVAQEDSLFNPTQGCLNAGPSMKGLLETLVRLGIVRKDQIHTPEPATSPTLGWKVIPKIGNVFLIVRDY
ncbi:MAG: hypothetical protein KDD51_01935 [Bdellovibrionales bacterium]|nr:hypothetical protein [Bdellovibrionales bacterium]